MTTGRNTSCNTERNTSCNTEKNVKKAKRIVSFRPDLDVLTGVEEVSRREGVSISQVINRFLRKALQSEEYYREVYKVYGEISELKQILFEITFQIYLTKKIAANILGDASSLETIKQKATEDIERFISRLGRYER